VSAASAHSESLPAVSLSPSLNRVYEFVVGKRAKKERTSPANQNNTSIVLLVPV
jgi:hypothetical protein